MSILTLEECQALIELEHEWKISTLFRTDNSLVYENSYEKRTFNEAPVVVFGKQYPLILKEVITKYEVGDFCSLHKDNSWRHEHPGYQAYAVWITPLNDGYEGGDLYFNNELVEQIVGQPVKNDRRIRHEITEVTKGTRYSLVSWIFRKQT